LRSLLGVKQTSLIAAHMSADDPKRTYFRKAVGSLRPLAHFYSIHSVYSLGTTNGGQEYGWTSVRNLRGKFVNETLGEVPAEAGAGKYGPNAAWERGKYLGHRVPVEIVDVKLEIERIVLDTVGPYLVLVEAAAHDGVLVAINSGFRSYPEQKALYEGYQKGLPGYNTAAPPGRSAHQNGVAFDIRIAGGIGDPTYEWLTKNGPMHGFIRTVNNEPWHWEYNKVKASTVVAAHTYKTNNVEVYTLVRFSPKMSLCRANFADIALIDP